MTNKILISFFSLFLLSSSMFAQPGNNECFTALELTDVNEYCSVSGEFSTIGATDSGVPAPSCYPPADPNLDVWFYFVATANTVNINVIGAITINPGGSMQNPQATLYDDNCLGTLNEVACFTDAFNNDFAEIFATGLLPGNIYYIRVSARAGAVGTFQLCVNNYNQPPTPSSDCPTAVILCDKSNFSVEHLFGGGNDINEILGASCIDPLTCGAATETNSAWYVWTCDQPGSLTFSLTPNNPDDDLDFVVYELPNGPEDCSGKIELRCMASGANTNEPVADWIECTGATGLQIGDGDSGEACGCQDGNNNFAEAITMVAGRSYALIVNNFSPSDAGFSINWGGTGTFLGPEVDFAFNPPDDIECDEEITLVDASLFGGGSIVDWNWYFGQGATPQTANSQGPHPVTWTTFGEKLVTLTIESDGGCLVTKTITLDVLECCAQTGLVDLSLVNAADPNCPGASNGSIEVDGSGGNPAYVYSIDDGNPIPIPIFGNLPEGDYTITMQDTKGCEDEIDVNLMDPPPVVVDAGTDETITLGETIDLNAIITPFDPSFIYQWNDPDQTLSCTDCLDPTALPFQNTTYEITVFNDQGCESTDFLTIMVNDERPIFIPNAISPNGDGANDRFWVFGNAAATEIKVMRIFNRWGALVYEREGIPLGTNSVGWDGTFNGKDVNPDVYTYYIEVLFIDNNFLPFSGDVTVIR